MTPYRKKMIEVALPLKAINEASAREKSIRHGHPSTLHLWWARRPLAACRAVLFASLVDDPDSDPEFRLLGEEMTGKKRADLFNLIEELVQWENSNNPEVIRSARAEIARCVASRLLETGKLTRDQVLADGMTVGLFVTSCHCRCIAGGLDEKAGRVRFRFETRGLPPAAVVDNFLAEYAPPVLDPFCGGGSIPLEAQRLGLRAYASDLNPVPVLITKALIEIPPKFAGRAPINPEWQGKHASEKAARVWQGAQGLAEDVRYYGKWMRDEAEKRIGHLYPKVKITKEMAKERSDLKEYAGQELTVIAWLWARTVRCPNPACGLEMPLAKTFWLSKKTGGKTWVEPVTDHERRSVNFRVHNAGVPTTDGTVGRRGATCIGCKTPVPFDYLRAEGKAGRMSCTLMTLVTEMGRQRIFLSPTEDHAACATKASPTWIPARELANNPFSLRPPLYGLRTFDQLFTRRQLVALSTFSDLIADAYKSVLTDAECDSKSRNDAGGAASPTGPHAYADAVVTYLALGVSRLSDICNSLCMWENTKTQVRHVFTRQAIPMLWDFAEPNLFAGAAGDFGVSLSTLARVLESLGRGPAGTTKQLDACAKVDGINPVVSTDPPYYDNIDYADLSDFFYVWLRRCLTKVYPDLFSTVLVPKAQELVATPYRFEGDKQRAKDHFLTGLAKAFSNMRVTQHADYPLTVFYAFKQSESDIEDEQVQELSPIASTGWETMLEGLSNTGFAISGTWPIRTELSNRPMASGMNSLASSVVIVCRIRPTDARLATRKDFMNALRRELPDALKNLQHGNIAPVDLAQASIGPGMSVFTRFSKVIETDGSSMSVRTALGIINQILDEVLAEQEGEFDADTRWALAWFEQFGIDEGAFGDAETLSKAKDTAINGLVEAGIVKARRGKVQLVGRADLPEDWNPAKDKRLTVWETTQHLIRTLETKGELEAAALLNNLGGVAEIARDLAYRLYSICERKKWAEEALAYNGLVIAWPELTKLALSERTRQPSTQQELF